MTCLTPAVNCWAIIIRPLRGLDFAACPLPTAHCPLLTAHRSPLTAHRSLPTAHCSLPNAHRSLPTDPGAIFSEQVPPTIKRVRVDVIVNVKAGTHTADETSQSVRDAFSASGVAANVFLAKTGAEVVEQAKRSVAGDASAIVAAGGDGTINSVASAMVDSGKALGVIPFGTMNHFAKDLHIPLELEGAVQTIVDGHTIKVDVGEVNGQIFVNNSSLGLYPSIVSERQRQQRLGSGKWPAYIWAAFAVLRRYPFLNTKVKVENKELTSRTPFVFVGNNEYQMETLNIGGRAALDAGELSLYMTSDITRLGLVRLALRALFGGLRQEKDFLALRTDEIVIATKHKRVRVALDGEVTVMQPPLHFRIRPKALSVLTLATGEQFRRTTDAYDSPSF